MGLDKDGNPKTMTSHLGVRELRWRQLGPSLLGYGFFQDGDVGVGVLPGGAY